jgi:hypothetical protein
VGCRETPLLVVTLLDPRTLPEDCGADTHVCRPGPDRGLQVVAHPGRQPACVGPLGEDPAAAFARLAEIRAGFLAGRPEATWLSAGMSNDLEAAIGAGATHVRVGSAILGERPRIQ